MNEKIYVVGHRNPDSDSICSAIAYANLKQQLNVNTVACRLGPLNEETKYILRKFNLENPLLMDDARSQLSDIVIDKPNIIDINSTVKQAWKQVLVNDNHGLCVVDNNKLVGFITPSNLSMLRLTHYKDVEKMMQNATLESIASTIKGEVVLNVDNFSYDGSVYIYTLNESDEYIDKLKNSICVLSDNVIKQREVIEAGAKCLVISCGMNVTEEILAFAKERNCAIITATKDSMAIAQVINESFPVKYIMATDLITYNEDDYVDDVLKKILNYRYRSFPVLDKDGNLLGTVSRFHLFKPQKKKFILVDHSAKNQSIKNIDKAQVLEIIDHHHIGNIETDYPIYYRNQICGCSATIVAQLYQENSIEPSVAMAGIMLSAIISDTLHFKSATTTKLDIDIAKWLSELAKVDIDTYAKEMLSASIALIDSTPTLILNRDLKKYEIDNKSIAIGQTNYYNFEDLQSILPEFRSNLEKECKTANHDLLIMVFTHVAAEGSMFVYSGELSYIMEDVIETTFDSNSGYDRSIISRKQQLVPKVLEIVKEI